MDVFLLLKPSKRRLLKLRVRFIIGAMVVEAMVVAVVFRVVAVVVWLDEMSFIAVGAVDSEVFGVVGEVSVVVGLVFVVVGVVFGVVGVVFDVVGVVFGVVGVVFGVVGVVFGVVGVVFLVVGVVFGVVGVVFGVVFVVCGVVFVGGGGGLLASTHTLSTEPQLKHHKYLMKKTLFDCYLNVLNITYGKTNNGSSII